jgi:hypothetical protein
MVAVVVAALALGCGNKGEEKKAEEKKAEEKKAEEKKAEAPKVPETADGVVKEAIKALGEKDPGRIYFMLPDSYQKDIQGIKDTAVEKLDKETVDNFLKALDKAIAGVAKHKEKLLAGELPIPGISKEAIGPAVDQLVAVWGVLKAAGLDTYDGWKGLDVGQFLLQNGKAILTAGLDIASKTEQGAMVGMFTAMLAGIAVEVKEAGDEVTVLTVGMDKDRDEVKFVKVEGRWIPEDLQKGWAKAMEQAKEGLAEGLAEYEGQKDAMKAMSGVLLAAATTFEETGDLNQLMGAFGGPAPAAE